MRTHYAISATGHSLIASLDVPSDATARGSASHHLALPTIGAREAQLWEHPGCARHPPIRPIHVEPLATRLTTSAPNAAVPTSLWATPDPIFRGTAHTAG